MTKLVFNALTGTFDLVQNLSGYALLAGRAGGQVLVGGSAVTDALVLQGTSGNGTLASPSVQLKVGNNGGTVAMTALNNGNVGIGTTSPLHYLDITKSAENQRTVYGVNAVMTAATLQQDATATGSDQTLTNRYYAWPFTASASHTVGSWAIRLKTVGTVTNTTDYIRLKIYSDNAGVPNTLLLTTDLVRMGSLTSSYVSYLFGGDLTLVSGTTYWVAVERSAVVTGGGSIAVDYNGTALTTATVAAPTSGDWTVSAGLGRYVVYGRSPLALYGNSTNSYGFRGNSTNSYGVYGSSTNSYGVYGNSTNNYGVYGVSTNSIGVYGISTNSYGVYGISTNSIGVYGVSTNSYGGIFYQEGTLTSANSSNTVLIRRYGVTNSTGSLNYSGNVLQITDNPTGTGTVSGALISGSVDGTTRLNFDPRVVDGASAVAYMLDTKNTLANATARLFTLRNGGSDKVTVLGSGNVGIGTTSPSVGKLQINGYNYNQNLITLQASNQTSMTYGIGTYLTGTGAGFVIRDNSSALERLVINDYGNVGIGTTSPGARLHIKAGTASVNTAPLKFTSGTLNTTAEAGAVEFLTDDFFATITTGAARKAFVLDDGTRLTSGRIPFATTNGRLTDDADLTFATDTLTATKMVGTTSIKVGTAGGYLSSDGSAGATGTFTTVDGKTCTVKDGLITSIV